MSCQTLPDCAGQIDVTSLKDTLQAKPSIQLVDVRTSQECAQGMIAHAIQLELTASNFTENAIAQLTDTKPVYLYCKTGVRSKRAARILHEKGFEVIVVSGGYKAWLDLKK